MRPRLMACVLMTVGFAASPGRADAPAAPAPMQPPMNALQYAFYECDEANFEIDYDSETPEHATIITHSRRYDLDRTASESGVQFSKAGVSFWTDGRKVRADGLSLTNCRLKPT
jgi:membrane-bound inhibitor of C-type lysozyme